MFSIIVHGGAGFKEKNNAMEGVKKACEKGIEILKNKGSSLDAVIESCKVLEEEEIFNAGRGSVLRNDGSIKLDAACMTSEGLKAGAIACIEGFLYASEVARKVMELTPHVLLVGREAEKFAEMLGFKKENLYTKERIELWNKILKKPREELEKMRARVMETIGACAIDEKGELAVCTSTGGLFFSMNSRVGDTPLIGCGTYANEFGAVSATGIGEDIIRVTLARYAVFLIEQGKNAQEAAELSIKYFEERTGSFAGIIVVDNKYNIGFYKNTKLMPVAYFNSEKNELEVKV
jgi:beta-aspartyl-peptidase (threonine type)